MEKTATYWIRTLNLISHPEGGFYSETYQSPDRIEKPGLPTRYSAARASAKAIYFLLSGEQVSKFHRLQCEEIWCYHCGSPLTIYIIEKDGTLHQQQLGTDFEKGEHFQLRVPYGVWFGAEIHDKASYSLVSCITTPGFDFEDFELAEQQTLLREYSQHKQLIEMLT